MSPLSLQDPINILLQQDGVTEIPLERWDVDQYFDEDAETPGMMTAPDQQHCLLNGRTGGWCLKLMSVSKIYIVGPRDVETLNAGLQ